MTYIIVTENKKPIGIIGFRDIVMKLMGEKTAFGNIYAEKIMTSPIITVKKDRDAKEIYNLMIGMGFRSLPVVDNKENLVGCITINDLVEKFGKKD
jgi:CBS domain-containing protein